MSWQQWQGAVPPSIVNPASSVLNPAATAMPLGLQYTPEQWQQMQQQNWQQWAQWQQQYQQWHQQYGAEYHKTMNAISGQSNLAANVPSSLAPPVPNTTAAPPPLPQELKPPLPPEEPPQPCKTPFQGYSSGPSKPSTSQGYTTAPDQFFNKNSNQKPQPWKNQPNMSKPPPVITKQDFGVKRSYSNQQENQDQKRNKFEQNWQSQPSTAPSTSEELSESEKKFMKQFAEWEAQFNKWKEQNQDHPDKTQYKEYEKKWEAWRNQLLERREQMRKRRLGINADAAAPKSAQSNLPNVSKPPPTINNEPLQFKSKPPDFIQHEEESPFLKTNSSGGIPGLDLVGEPDTEDKDAIEKAKVSKGPDLDALSKNINSILGDQKLLSMLSMVTKNQSLNNSEAKAPEFHKDIPEEVSRSSFSQDDSRSQFPKDIWENKGDWGNKGNNSGGIIWESKDEWSSKDNWNSKSVWESKVDWDKKDDWGTKDDWGSKDDWGEKDDWGKKDDWGNKDKWGKNSSKWDKTDIWTKNDNWDTQDSFTKSNSLQGRWEDNDYYKKSRLDDDFKEPRFEKDGPGDSVARKLNEFDKRSPFKSPCGFEKPPNDNVKPPIFEPPVRFEPPDMFEKPSDNFGNNFDRGPKFDFKSPNDIKLTDSEFCSNEQRSPFRNFNDFRNSNDQRQDFRGPMDLDFRAPNRTDFRGPNDNGPDFRNTNDQRFNKSNDRRSNDLFSRDQRSDFRGPNNNFQRNDKSNDFGRAKVPRMDMDDRSSNFNRNHTDQDFDSREPFADGERNWQHPAEFYPNEESFTNAEPEEEMVVPEAPVIDDILNIEKIINYEHKSIKPANSFEVAVEPPRLFDYRHKAVNRIPLPDRPRWLQLTLQNLPEFEPCIGKAPLITNNHRYNLVERFNYRSGPSIGRYDDYISYRRSPNRYPEDRRYPDIRRHSEYQEKYEDHGRGRDGREYRRSLEPPEVDHRRNREVERGMIEKSRKVEKTSSVVLIDDILNPPERFKRPTRIVIVLRGPPGSGKTFLAKLIKDREVENGGSAPRILSLDDYFMVEQEKEVTEDGKKIKIKEMVYEYEECMEASYRTSLLKSFKKTITDGYFPFIIVDNVNDKIKYFSDMWSFAKQNGFQVYVCQLELDVQVCTKRNKHGRSEIEIEHIVSGWENTPSHYTIVDATNLIQAGSIAEVEMEEINSPNDNFDDEDENEEQACNSSKWDNFECSVNNLAKLDGISKPLRSAGTMEDYLQLDDWTPTKNIKPGQKRVRWADLEERKEQEKMRAIGFVVGQTDWGRMMDPTQGSSALTRTKYIERVRKH